MVHYSTTLTLFLLHLLLSLTPSYAHEGRAEWNISNIHLPTGLSDMSATFLPYVDNSKIVNGNSIIIAGGCDAENGNEFFDATAPDVDFFFCSSTSVKVYGFEPQNERYMILADMPRPRYRHAAVEIGGKIWCVGGRTVPEDAIIPEIDVYDPVTDSWSTPITLPEYAQTSDNAAFVDPDHKYLYVVGGYDATYASLSNVWKIEIASALQGNLAITAVASMETSRGDIHAVSSADGSSVFVTGGFKHYPCQPLQSVERYDFTNRIWTTVAELKTARGDKALVEMGGLIYAVGGETIPLFQCNSPDDWPDPLSAESLPVDDVEVYDPNEGSNANWTTIANIPNFRFRFAAEAWEDSGIIYGFGGQEAYNAECKCFKTSDLIVTYTPHMEHDHETSSSASTFNHGASNIIIVMGLVLAWIFIGV